MAAMVAHAGRRRHRASRSRDRRSASLRRAAAAMVGSMRLDPLDFSPGSVPAATLAVTERLRHRDGSVLRVEPQSELAVERTIAGPGGPLRLRVLSDGTARALYLHLHGGGWALGGPDRQDQTLLAFGRAARVAVV